MPGAIQDLILRLKPLWSGGVRVESVVAFDPVEKAIGATLPADYKFFLMWSNGGETLEPLTFCKFYPLEELIPRRVDGQPPDVLEFATDDSMGYGFDLLVGRASSDHPVLRYPLGDTTRISCEVVAQRFRVFVGGLLAG